MNEDARNAVEATAASMGMKATVGGAAGGFVGLISSSTFISLASLLIGAIGLVVTIYFKIRGDRRDQEEHEVRMRKLQQESARAVLDGPRQSEGDDES